MSVFLVTYDLNEPGQNYPELYDAIKKVGNSCIHPLDSTWLVDSALGAQEIYNALRAAVDISDKLLIMEVKRHWWTNISQANMDWVRAHLA